MENRQKITAAGQPLSKRLRGRAIRGFGALMAVGATLLSGPAQAATVGADGGITLWLSWDDPTSSGASIDSEISEADTVPGGSGCGVTNAARAAAGEPNSPPSCAGSPCTGREKLIVDLQRGGQAICEATEGAHYLRRIFVSDGGRGWTSADVQWSIDTLGSKAAGGGWNQQKRYTKMRSAERTCIADIFAHELGHYLYKLPDRYARGGGYFQGKIGGGSAFPVNVTQGDPNTMMNSNFPHRFVDSTNGRIVVSYTPPGGDPVSNEVLTPGLLSDADPDNDGPDRAHHGHTMPFATDEWSLLPLEHVDLAGIHTEGQFPVPADCPETEVVFVGDDVADPGTILVLDRSGSMSVENSGIQAVQYVQEAGLFLYHSADEGERVGTFLYNDRVDALFSYGPYDATNDLAEVDFREAEGATDIAGALDRAIDTLENSHPEAGPNGARIILLSDGVQTTGQDLWTQVDRAGGLGIRIDTLSFGNADEATMTAIAGNTAGQVTSVSERENANELKMVMARQFSELRGRTPIFTHLGKIPEDEIVSEDGMQQWSRTFVVPPFSGDLQVYDFFPREMPKGEFALRLVSPSGEVFTSEDPDNLEELGRFLGLRVKRPQSGEWLLVVRGENRVLAEKGSEIAVFARNRYLDATVMVDQLVPQDSVRIVGQAEFAYPLTELKVLAHLYAAGDYITSIPLVDDGTVGLDDGHEDGLYSGRLALDGSDPALAAARANGVRKFRIELEFRVQGESLPAPRANYETGTDVERLKEEFHAFDIEGLRAWATTVLTLEDKTSPAGKVTISAESNPLELQPGESGEFIFRIEGARPSISNLRLDPGAGIILEHVEESECATPIGLGLCVRTELRATERAAAGANTLRVQSGFGIIGIPEVILIGAEVSGCPYVPMPVCNEAGRASMLASERRPGKESLRVHLGAFADELSVESFTSPDASNTKYHLCVYGDEGRLLQMYDIDRSAEMCGRRPCWKAKADKGYQMVDKEGASDGINKVLLLASSVGGGKVTVMGANNARRGYDELPLVADVLAAQQSPTVQFISDRGLCVGASSMSGFGKKPGLYLARK